MSWLSILLMTAAHTFWLFYVAGNIPGTMEHRMRNERLTNADNERIVGDDHLPTRTDQ